MGSPRLLRPAPPGGESVEQFLARVAAAFAFAVQRRASMQGALAVVTHGLVVRAVIGRHLALADGQAVPPQVRNTSVTIVGWQPPHRAELIDCVRHLDADAAPDARGLSGG
jgi:probable phosphoglycerate mutase